MKLSLLLFLLIIFSCNQYKKNQTYKVSLRFIPQTLNVRESLINTDSLIISHLYYPLFDLKANGNYSSKFLNLKKTKALNENFDHFKLCLLNDIVFSDHSKITVEDLIFNLKEIHRTQEYLPEIAKIKQQDECAIITFVEPDYKYFSKLTSTSSTVLKINQQHPYPIGYGPYKIKEIHSGKILLEAFSKKTVKSFTNVKFSKFVSVSNEFNHNYDDWNYIGQIDIPEFVKKNTRAITHPIMKVYAFVINHPEKSKRLELINCLDINKIKSVFNIDLIQTPGFLPNGFYGFDVSFNKNQYPKCNYSQKNKEKISFYNYNETHKTQLERFLYKSNPKLNFEIELKHVSASDMANLLYSGKNYIALIGFDTSSTIEPLHGESSVFFESFYRKNRIIKHAIPELQKNVTTALNSNSREVKHLLYAEAHKIILESGHVVPLGQLNKVFYYDQSISNINWFDRLGGIIKIHELIKK